MSGINFNNCVFHINTGAIGQSQLPAALPLAIREAPAPAPAAPVTLGPIQYPDEPHRTPYRMTSAGAKRHLYVEDGVVLFWNSQEQAVKSWWVRNRTDWARTCCVRVSRGSTTNNDDLRCQITGEVKKRHAMYYHLAAHHPDSIYYNAESARILSRRQNDERLSNRR